MKLRRTKEITLTILVAIAAAACEESKQPVDEELKHCVDADGVVQDESKCHDAPVQPPTGSDGGPAHHSGGGGGHFFWYYGGTRAPVAPGGRVSGGSHTPTPGKAYSPPSISKGGFGSTGKGYSSPGAHGGGGGGE
jgi:hypothetical protein